MRTAPRKRAAAGPGAVPPRDGDMLAALDLGSNSFHMVVAQRVLGQLRVVDRLRETVRLAEGLDGRGGLAPPVQARALDCLSRFGQRIADIPPQRVRAVATNTVRKLAHPHAFLGAAETALGHGIEVISGREEARLVYLGVAHAQPPPPGRLRLVVDIGGGSTECIIGAGLEAIERESVQAGAVADTRRHFADGKLSRRRWKHALAEVGAQFQLFASGYRALGWDEAVGSSGTIKAVGQICAAMGLTKGAITADALGQVRDALLRSQRLDDIELPGLSRDRQPIIAGGVLVLEAVFAALSLQRMVVSKGALREGVLVDMLGRGGADDPRDVSVAALMQRYGVDAGQARRVEQTALALFDQVAGAWQLGAEDRQVLARAARVHEVGLAIAHSGYHVHGAYILEHSDIAGFAQQEQRLIAALVRTHRRGIPRSAFEMIPDRLLANARRSAALLRLAVLLHRSHEADEVPVLGLHADGERISLTLGRGWLQARPLLRADLEGEAQDLQGLGLQLRLEVE